MARYHTGKHFLKSQQNRNTCMSKTAACATVELQKRNLLPREELYPMDLLGVRRNFKKRCSVIQSWKNSHWRDWVGTKVWGTWHLPGMRIQGIRASALNFATTNHQPQRCLMNYLHKIPKTRATRKMRTSPKVQVQQSIKLTVSWLHLNQMNGFLAAQRVQVGTTTLTAANGDILSEISPSRPTMVTSRLRFVTPTTTA
jgi:hypothetical protein